MRAATRGAMQTVGSACLLFCIVLPLSACGGGDADDEAAPDAGAADLDAGAADPDCPQAAHFLDVSGGSAGPGYPAPELSARCEGDEVIVESNGIPNFTFVQVTPNALQAHPMIYRLPRAPTPAARPAAVPLGGEVAVAVNGLMIFGPTEAPQMGYRDPILDDLMDACNGHTAPRGMYHFHARPDCLFTDLEGNTSLVVAYALDGYPILAPFTCTDAACTATRELRSSWQRIAAQFDASGNPLYQNTPEGAWDVHAYVAGSGDLDQCNGRDLPGGGYAYYATDTFPYLIGCYHGTVP